MQTEPRSFVCEWDIGPALGQVCVIQRRAAGTRKRLAISLKAIGTAPFSKGPPTAGRILAGISSARRHHLDKLTVRLALYQPVHVAVSRIVPHLRLMRPQLSSAWASTGLAAALGCEDALSTSSGRIAASMQHGLSCLTRSHSLISGCVW